MRKELLRPRNEQNINDNEFYHFDTPLTVEHEKECLYDAGFRDIKVIKEWENTKIIVAEK